MKMVLDSSSGMVSSEQQLNFQAHSEHCNLEVIFYFQTIDGDYAKMPASIAMGLELDIGRFQKLEFLAVKVTVGDQFASDLGIPASQAQIFGLQSLELVKDLVWAKDHNCSLYPLI